MATNVVYEKRSSVRIELTVGASKTSGSVEFLNDMPVFLLEDSDSDNKATVELIGCGLVVDLSVVGADGSGNSAVAVGDKIFKDGSAYNKDSINGTWMGYALGTVSSGSTTTIPVALVGGTAEAGLLNDVTATAAELNVLDGITSTTAELNILDGVTSTAAELNILDGVTSTAAELNILDGVTATADELNLVDNQVASATFVVGAEAANVINVAVQLKDAAGTDMATRVCLPWYLSGDANGDSLATAPTGGIAIGTDGLLIETLDNQAGLVTSEADGDIDVDITDTGTPTMYLVLVLPNGSLAISGAITFA